MKGATILTLCFLLFPLVFCVESLYDSMPSDDNAVDEDGFRLVWDFIIVGAGASGNIVAARLANETNKRVLLLEGGAKHSGQRDIGGTDYVASDFKTDPATGLQVLDTPLTRYDVPTAYDSIRLAASVLNNTWNITAIGPFFAQAKIIGGNHASNGLVWYPPRKSELDDWNVPGFDSASFWPYFKRIENATETGFPNRGYTGRTNVNFPSFLPLEQSRFINASISAGYSNGGDMANGMYGTGWFYTQTNEKAGIRQSTSITYLPGVIAKQNFELRAGATVTRVLFDSQGNATGVEYVNRAGVSHKVYAKNEVVLSAGDLQVVKILYNSGIGPVSILDAFGKPHRVVHEVIGQKIRNHQRTIMTFSDPSILNANFYSYPALSVQYARDGTGPYDKRGVSLETKVDPASPFPDILITIGAAGTTPSDVYGQILSVVVYLNINKYANGTLNLTSSDPLAGTLFRANTFLIEDDVVLLSKGLKEARRVMSHWNSSTIVEVAPGTSVNTTQALIDWIRAHPFTTCHYYGGAPMGTDPSTPCDARMRLRGVRRLRLVSTSVIPGPVVVGMQATALALGEKGTDLIKEDYGL